jgi:predicted ATPase/class 3 adenylate cyclase
MQTALESSLAGYVPRVVRQRLSRGPDQLPFLWSDQGVVLFADISGFTRLTEELGQQGGEGIEVLSRTLNLFFGGLLECIRRWDGDVIKFAGDALLAVWSRALVPESSQSLIYRATACAKEMQAFSEELRSKTPFPLHIRIGLDWGDLLFLHLQNRHQHWEVILSGPAVSGAFSAEGKAEPSQIVLGNAAGRWCPSGTILFPIDDHCAVVHEVPSLEIAKIPYFEEPNLPESWLLNYLPEVVRFRLAAGQQNWLAELRQVSVLFLLLPALTSEQLPRWMSLIQERIAFHGGTVNKLNLDEKGLSLLAVFGLPPASHENNAQRAVTSALELKATIEGYSLSASMGITSGRVFCGEVGSDWRREYTLLGDTVNTAARLMKVSGQQIVCDRQTWMMTQTQFDYETLPPVQLKGKNTSLEVFAPRSALTTHLRFDAQIGRTQETEKLLQMLQQLRNQRKASLVFLEGEAGLGKTTLVRHVLSEATRKGSSVLMSEADNLYLYTPWFAWRSIFQQILGLTNNLSPRQRLEELRNRMSFYPHLQELIPLLGPVLDLEIPDNAITLPFRGEARQQNTLDVMTAVLQDAVSIEPLLIVLDNCQWLDAPSWQLVEQIRYEVPGLMVLLVTRPMAMAGTQLSDSCKNIWSELQNSQLAETLLLGRMSKSEIQTLVASKLGVNNIPAEVIQLIASRAEGHPFFSQELALSLRESGYLNIVQGNCQLTVSSEALQQLQLPNSIEGVIVSRIDRLSPSQQLGLKIASVMGRLFDFKALYDIYPVEQDRAGLLDALSALENINIIELVGVFPSLSYVFRHNLTHQAIYSLMLSDQRRDLHQQVAAWFEKEYEDELENHINLLAHHWQEARVAEKSSHYLFLAGKLALEEGLYKEAIYFISQSLKQAPEDLSSEKVAAIHQLLGEAHYGLGQMAESQAQLEKALALSGYPPAPNELTTRKLLPQILAQFKHRLRSTATWIDPDKKRKLITAAQICERLGQIYYLNGEKDLGLHNGLRILNLCEEAGPSPQLARAYANISLICGFVGQRALAEFYARKALQYAEELDDLSSRAWVQQLTGLYSLGQAQWEQAENGLFQSMELYRRQRDMRHCNESMGLLAAVRYFQGQHDRALELSQQSSQLARNRGDRELEARALEAQAKIHLVNGRYQMALTLSKQARQLADALGGRLRIQPQALLLRLAIETNEVEQAHRLAEEMSQIQVGSQEAISAFEIEVFSAEIEYLLFCQKLACIPHNALSIPQIKQNFQEFAHRFPMAAPRFELYQGKIADSQGHTGAAKGHWKKSSKLAQKLGMPYEAELAVKQLEND